MASLKAIPYYGINKGTSAYTLGETTVDKVDKLVFTNANSISIFPNGSKIVYIKDFAFLQKCTNNTFTLLINSSILFGMLRPGIGQANFDEIMLSTKAAIRDL